MLATAIDEYMQASVLFIRISKSCVTGDKNNLVDNH